MRLNVEKGALHVLLQVDRASIESPGQCTGTVPTSRVQLRLRVNDGVHTPVGLTTVEHWACERNHGGHVTGLHFP